LVNKEKEIALSVMVKNVLEIKKLLRVTVIKFIYELSLELFSHGGVKEDNFGLLSAISNGFIIFEIK
jgi:hypothetical protein